jgi:hypothetical protein
MALGANGLTIVGAPILPCAGPLDDRAYLAKLNAEQRCAVLHARGISSADHCRAGSGKTNTLATVSRI